MLAVKQINEQRSIERNAVLCPACCKGRLCDKPKKEKVKVAEEIAEISERIDRLDAKLDAILKTLEIMHRKTNEEFKQLHDDTESQPGNAGLL